MLETVSASAVLSAVLSHIRCPGTVMRNARPWEIGANWDRWVVIHLPDWFQGVTKRLLVHFRH